MGKRDLISKALAAMQKERPDLKAAFDILQTAARQKNSEALYAIGTWYLFGRYVKKNIGSFQVFFLQAIEGNRSDAYYDLGVCYEKGVGIRNNKKAAFECYLNAALLGNMPDSNNSDDKLAVVDLVNGAIVADADAPGVAAS